MVYSLAMFVLRATTSLIARITVIGSENLPSGTASFMAVFNHIGRLDPAVIYYLLKRNDIIALVAEKYKHYLWSRLLVYSVDGIFVNRYNADLNALREVFRRIKKGGVIILAPEGTRSPTNSLQEAWDGASYIAAKSGLPIIPIGLTGSGDKEVVSRLTHLKRLDIQVHIGKEFSLPPLGNKTRTEQLIAYTAEIMSRIAVLLPESQRGFYAQHPRLQALLEEEAVVNRQPEPVAD